MKKIKLFVTTILFLGFSIPALAQVRVEITAPPPPPPPSVRVAVPLPPPIPFAAPPEVIVLPETEVYVVPSVTEEIFFYSGYWWRPWHGRWYRSLRYDGGWVVIGGVPGWYRGIPYDWRDNYRHHLWGGHPWNYHPISHADLHRNWRTWHNTGHWNKPEHREFTHHHDGRVYTGHRPDTKNVNKGATHANVNKGTTGTGQAHVNKGVTGPGQGHVNKGVTQSSASKGTGGTGQGHVSTGATQGNINRNAAAQGNINRGGAAAGHGNPGAAGHGAAGNVHNSGQATKNQHN